MTSRPRPGVTSRLRRVVWELRTEGAGPVREAAAIGLGIFIGCSPLYGFHLLLCVAVGWCLGLNRLKMYLAANISNPFVAPFLILTELQTGAWLRRDELHALTVEAVRNVDPWSFGADLIVGSLAVGGVLAVLGATATYFMARTGHDDPWFVALVRRAADRYVSTSITAWEFARGKLRGDPLYRTVLTECTLPSGGTLVDVGCGQGLMLALLAECETSWRAGTWPSSWAPPATFDRLVGIETRPRVAAIARQALGEAASIVEGDARTHVPDGARVVLFFDVLHMMPAADQEQLLASTAARLDAGGMILIREPDAGAGWRFAAVRAGNTAKALLSGHWRQTISFQDGDRMDGLLRPSRLPGRRARRRPGNALRQSALRGGQGNDEGRSAPRGEAHGLDARVCVKPRTFTTSSRARPSASSSPPNQRAQAICLSLVADRNVSSSLGATLEAASQQNRMSDHNTSVPPSPRGSVTANPSSCARRKLRTVESDRELVTGALSGSTGHANTSCAPPAPAFQTRRWFAVRSNTRHVFRLAHSASTTRARTTSPDRSLAVR